MKKIMPKCAKEGNPEKFEPDYLLCSRKIVDNKRAAKSDRPNKVYRFYLLNFTLMAMELQR